VAVTAIDPDAADMVLMRELNRLLSERVGSGDEIRPLQHQDEPPESQDQTQQADQTCAGPLIGTLPENLRHGSEHF
jgi:hypothetical protein